jgi:hypothetical protein
MAVTDVTEEWGCMVDMSALGICSSNWTVQSALLSKLFHSTSISAGQLVIWNCWGSFPTIPNQSAWNGPASTNGLLPATVVNARPAIYGHSTFGRHLLRLWSAAKSWVLPLTS